MKIKFDILKIMIRLCSYRYTINLIFYMSEWLSVCLIRWTIWIIIVDSGWVHNLLTLLLNHSINRPFNKGHVFILLEFRLCSSEMGDIRPEVLRHKFEVLQTIKEVVHHAAKLNEAMRGVPLTRAHFTYGGYYDAGL